MDNYFEEFVKTCTNKELEILRVKIVNDINDENLNSLKQSVIKEINERIKEDGM